MKSDNAGALGKKAQKIGNVAEADEVLGMGGRQCKIQVFQNPQSTIAAPGADNAPHVGSVRA